ncbi:hypothetical protein PAMA_009415 [Pampus argenteus]
MSFAKLLTDSDVAAALAVCKDAGTFNHKKFFKACGLTGKADADIENAFNIIDRDNSGYIEEEELKLFLQNFDKGGRALSDAETKDFLKAGDTDGDGKIGVGEFVTMVKAAKGN